MPSLQHRHNKLWSLAVTVLLLYAPCYAQTTPDASDALLPSAPWTYEGVQVGDEVGTSVSSAGDVNGDGFADALVGAPHADGASDRTGAAYVFLGPIPEPKPIPDFTLSGPRNGSLFGISVSSAGDFDGDGLDDVIVGAPEHRPSLDMPKAGGAFIYRGSAAGIQTTPELSLIGDVREIRLGASVAGAGDIDGDGYDDVVIGVPNYSYGLQNRGQIRVVYGMTSTAILSATLRTQTIEGDQANALFGASVAFAGDVNGDGYADVLVGAPYYEHSGLDNGAAFLFLGSISGLVPAPAWTAYSHQLTDNSAHSVTYGAVVGTAGDVNGDTFDDWFVSAPGYDGDFVDEGLVDVFYGQATGLSGVGAGWSKTSATAGALFGAGVGTGGDINGDTYADLVIGMPFYDSTTSGSSQNVPEAVFIYLGSEHGLRHIRAWKLTCNQSSTDFGQAVSSAGDTDNDGYDDLLVGAPRYKRDEQVRGQAFGYLGVEGDGIFFSVYLPLVIKHP